MIEVKELHIGAHVMHKGKRYRVAVVYGELVGLIIGKDEKNGESVVGIPSDEIEPIYLTNELLEEIGFELRSRSGYSGDGGVLDTGDYFIWVDDCEGHYWGCQIRERFGLKDDIVDCCGFNALHQLENIVYNATEIELIKDN